MAHDVVSEGTAPHAACGVGVLMAGAFHLETGGDDLFFDLASVTKPMTALAVARSGMRRQAPLGTFLPEVRGTESEGASLELLLCHRAGLAPHTPLWEWLRGGMSVKEALRRAATLRRDDALGPIPEQGFAPVYSDLGYILVGAALARHMGVEDVGDAVHKLVVAPFGLESLLGTAAALARRGVLAKHGVAKTEWVPWRGGVVCGEVHDENAWMLSGLGASGHAGFFGTIEGVLRLGRVFLDETRTDEARWLVARRPCGTLLAGFDGKSEAGSSAGEHMGPNTFGHLGFTGTSLWVDPDANVVVSLLTNRVHPSRDNLKIRTVRPKVHDALFVRGLFLRETITSLSQAPR